MWKKLKELVPNKNIKQSQVKRLEVNANDETDSPKIAKDFNHYFVNIASKLAKKFNTDKLAQRPLPNKTNSVLHFKQVTGEKSALLLKSSKLWKSTGIDEISVKLLIAGAKSLSRALAFLFNYSIVASTVPKIWKRKRVSPIHKSGEKTDCCKYTPISIQPIPLKLLESVIHEQLRDYLTRENQFTVSQSGFRQNHSTSTAVIAVSQFIIDNISHGNYVGAIFLDLANAFDCVYHPILLPKMLRLGIRDSELAWFESFLNNRTQVTIINSKRSGELHKKPFGIPLGSVLGPISVLIYISNLTSVVGCKMHLYADDAALLVADPKAEELQVKLNSEINNARNG